MSKKFLFVDSEGFQEESPGAFEESDHTATSAGAGNAGDPIILNGSGFLDSSLFDLSTLDHGGLGGLGDDDHTIYTKADGTRAFTGDQSFGSNKITNVADGTTATDGINKGQLDAAVTGMTWKDAVRVASDADVASLTGISASDFDGTGQGVTLAIGDRVLLRAQTAGAENGIYEYDGADLVRTEDMNSGTEADGAATMTQEGTYADTGWTQTADSVTIGSTVMTWIEFTRLGQVSAGSGLSKTTTTINVGDANKGVQVNADDLEVDTSEIAALGLIQNTTNSWQLDIDFSTTFTDEKAVAAQDLNSTANGEGASIIGIEDVAGNFVATNVEDALAEIFGSDAGVEYTVAAGGVTKGDLLKISANNTVETYGTLSQSHRGIGLAGSTEIAAAQVIACRNDKVLSGVLTSATAGTPYYWNGTSYQTTIPPGSGSHVWQVGVAKNATDLHVEIRLVKKNA